MVYEPDEHAPAEPITGQAGNGVRAAVRRRARELNWQPPGSRQARRQRLQLPQVHQRAQRPQRAAPRRGAGRRAGAAAHAAGSLWHICVRRATVLAWRASPQRGIRQVLPASLYMLCEHGLHRHAGAVGSGRGSPLCCGSGLRGCGAGSRYRACGLGGARHRNRLMDCGPLFAAVRAEAARARGGQRSIPHAARNHALPSRSMRVSAILRCSAAHRRQRRVKLLVWRQHERAPMTLPFAELAPNGCQRRVRRAA